MTSSIDFRGLIERLSTEKGAIIAKYGQDVEVMVENYGKIPVALRVGDTLYDPSHMAYIPVVTRFAFSDTKTYHELPIRSYVAQPVSNKVVELYSQFLDQHQADIQLKFEEELKKNINVQQIFYNIIRDEVLSRCVTIARDHVAGMVTQAI
jgi:hypothetical protein